MFVLVVVHLDCHQHS